MKDLFGYIKLGRLKKNIADQINRKPADIFIEYNYLRHIEKGKYFILDQFGINALAYVQKIVSNFTEIREGQGEALLLVAYIEESTRQNIVVIELQPIADTSIYIVKTAMPRRRFIESEVVIWQK